MTAGDRSKDLVWLYFSSDSSSPGRWKVPSVQTLALGSPRLGVSCTKTVSYQSPAAAPSAKFCTVQLTVKGASTEPGCAAVALVVTSVTRRSGSGGTGVPMMSMARAL